MRARFASAALVAALAGACQLSLDLDHTFHADAGDALAGGAASSQGGSDSVLAPSDGEAGVGGSTAASNVSGSSGVLGGSGGAGGYGPGAGSSGDSTPGAGGNSGTTGEELGTGGTSSTSGAGGSSDTASSGNGGASGGGGGTSQPLATCSGCVELIVPVSTTGDKAVFEFQFNDAPLDLSSAIVTWRVQAVNDTASDWSDSALMVLKAYAQSPPPPGSNPPGYFTDERMLSLDNFDPGEWQDLVIDVANFPSAEQPNDFDKSYAHRIGLELAAGSNFFGTHRIRLFVDSVRFEGVPGLSDRSFDTELEGFMLNTYAVPMSTRLEPHFNGVGDAG